MSGTTVEDLQTLSELVPLLAKKVSDSHEAAEALESAATELQREVDEAQQEAQGRLVALQDALPSLVVQVEYEEKALKEADTALLGAWHEAEPRFAHAGDAVVKHADDVVSHTHDLRAALVSAGTKIDQVQALGEAALAKLGHDLHEAEQRVQAALHTLEGEVEHLKQATQTANEALATAARDLLAVLTEATGHADVALKEVLEDMEAKTNAHKESADGLFSALGEHLIEKVDAADGEIQQAVMAPLAGAETHLRGGLEKIRAAATTHQKDLEEHGQALEQGLKQAKAEAATVPAGMAAIDNSARQLGIL
jgi:hypothetical protein